MKYLKYLLTGLFFGVVMVRSEAASWYRIQEMFRFQSWHMYGIIASAVALGSISFAIIKKLSLLPPDTRATVFSEKQKGWKKYLLGGVVFGSGWALIGACPGPLFVNLGYGYLSMLIPIAGALAGTFLYGVIRDKLPH